MSIRQVRRALKDLEEAGSIKWCGESEYRTDTWSIVMGRPDKSDQATGQIGPSEGTNTTKTLPEMSDKPSVKPSIEPSIEKDTSLEATEDDEFSQFWKQYPFRTGRGAARRAFTKARGITSFEEIMGGVSRYVAYVEHRRETDWPGHPWQGAGPWLNSERWADEFGTPEADSDERRRIEKARRSMSADQRAAAKSLAAFPYDNECAQIMGESKEVEDDSSTDETQPT
jgi:hypothetical protein